MDQNESEPDIIFKVVSLGESSVGKTSIINRYIKGPEIEIDKFDPTIAASFQVKIIHRDDKVIEFDLWDTAGQEMYRSLTPMYYRNAQAALLVFDITNRASFESLTDWYEQIQENSDNIFLMVLANKVDLEDQRKVQIQEITNFCDSHKNLIFCEVSALTGYGLDKAFDILLHNLLHQRQALHYADQVNIDSQNNGKTRGKPCC